VAIAQFAPILGDPSANLAVHRRAVERARDEGMDVLVFPELSMTGSRLKDSVPGIAVRRDDDVFTELAELSRDVSLLVGLVEESRGHDFYNSAVFFEAGRAIHVHRKVYLPTYGMFDEQRYFARGDRIRAFDAKAGRAAILICEDMLHPTAPTIAALDGAATIYVLSASPSRGVNVEGEVDANGRHWEAYNRTMARTLGVYVVYANRVGVEDGHTFWGGSEIVGPDGHPIAKASYYEDDFISATLVDEQIRKRRIQAPVLRDENVDLTINELMRIHERMDAREKRNADERRSRAGAAQRGRTERPFWSGAGVRRGGPRVEESESPPRKQGGRPRRDDDGPGGGRAPVRARPEVGERRRRSAGSQQAVGAKRPRGRDHEDDDKR